MPEPQENSTNWLVIVTTQGVIEATMIAERLRSLGIPAVVHNEPIGAAYGLTIGPLGVAKVLVPEAFFDRASGMLEARAGLDSFDDDFDEEFEDDEDDEPDEDAE